MTLNCFNRVIERKIAYALDEAIIGVLANKELYVEKQFCVYTWFPQHKRAVPISFYGPVPLDNKTPIESFVWSNRADNDEITIRYVRNIEHFVVYEVSLKKNGVFNWLGTKRASYTFPAHWLSMSCNEIAQEEFKRLQAL